MAWAVQASPTMDFIGSFWGSETNFTKTVEGMNTSRFVGD